MKLSVIIPCFNFRSYIEECVNSILSQNVNFDFEIIIRDDFSKDGTLEFLIEKYSNNPNIKILNSEKNIGAVNNLKVLLDSCSGEYIAHLDGDDYLTDINYYQRVIDFLDINKSYSLYCSGYKYFENGVFNPENGFLTGLKSEVHLDDMFHTNYVSFGRVFRNYKDIIKDWMLQLPYPDWAINCQIMTKGPAKCDLNHCVGIYRSTNTGMITAYDEDTKRKKHDETLIEIKKRYTTKTISIIDCFVYKNEIKEKLILSIERLRKLGKDIFLITNTPVDKDISSLVDYVFYDHNNRLFTMDKYVHNDIVFYKSMGWFSVHEIVPHLQRHGLSVLTNIFRSLTIAKTLGYTHFQRFEVDDLFGEKSLEWIKQVDIMCANENKKGLFYINRNNTPPDFSFHYYYCDIEYFLKKCHNIFGERDYDEFIKKYNNNNTFIMAEEFMFLNLHDSEEVILREGHLMFQDFSDTTWNTEVSTCNLEKKYNFCSTKLYVNYKKDENGNFNEQNNYVLLSYNYSDYVRQRKVIIKLDDNTEYTVYQNLGGRDSWAFEYIPKNTKSIEVFENEKIIFTEEITRPKSIIYFN
jgi:glycosyltransferase involved in cell wall biosynthesis